MSSAIASASDAASGSSARRCAWEDGSGTPASISAHLCGWLLRVEKRPTFSAKACGCVSPARTSSLRRTNSMRMRCARKDEVQPGALVVLSVGGRYRRRTPTCRMLSSTSPGGGASFGSTDSPQTSTLAQSHDCATSSHRRTACARSINASMSGTFRSASSRMRTLASELRLSGPVRWRSSSSVRPARCHPRPAGHRRVDVPPNRAVDPDRTYPRRGRAA